MPNTNIPGQTGPQGPAGPQGVAGPEGPAGQSFTWKGNWAIGTTYDLDDAVLGSDGSSYISIQANNLGHDPIADDPNAPVWWSLSDIHGAIGPPGDAATIAVGTTTTGAPGTNANVTNSGTTSAAVFDFTIPRGDVGAPGAPGAQGAIGPTGPQGIPGPDYIYQYARWIDAPNGGDTNSGAFAGPWKTLTKGSAGAMQRMKIFIAPGDYPDPVTWTTLNFCLAGMSNRSNIANVTGMQTFNLASSSVRIETIGLTGGITQAGAGNVFIDRCQVVGVTKTGTGYLEANNCDMENGAINITGAGIVTLVTGKYGNITINNAGAICALANPVNVTVSANGIHLIAGVLSLDGATVTLAAAAGVAITTEPGTTLIITSSRAYGNTGLPVGVNIAGNYHFTDFVFDNAQSTITGTLIPYVSTFSALRCLSTLAFAPTGGVLGRTAASSPAPGLVGEVVQNTGATAALVADTAEVCATISLSPGNWSVIGNVNFVSSAFTGELDRAICAISTSTTTYPAQVLITSLGPIPNAGGVTRPNNFSLMPVPTILTVSASTSVYLLCSAGFSGGTGAITCNGYLQAIRIC